MQDEIDLGLDKMKIYQKFKSNIEKNKKMLISFLSKINKRGQRVCGIGASTKGNVLLQYFGINSNLIESIGEVNSDKFGSYTPGSLIPLLQEDEVLDSEPDYLLVLPWHFKKFFLNLPKFKGRKLIFPLPQFEVIEV